MPALPDRAALHYTTTETESFSGVGSKPNTLHVWIPLLVVTIAIILVRKIR